MTRYVQSELGSTTCSRACRFLIARGAARGGLYTSARAHHWESEEFRFKPDSQTRTWNGTNAIPSHAITYRTHQYT